MQTTQRSWTVVGLTLAAVTALALTACGDDSAETEKVPPAVLESVPEGEIGRITLTDLAAQRLDIQTATIEEGSASALQAPFAAVIYQPDGSTWVYSHPEGKVYVREEIEIDRIEGDVAYLTSGPEPGTPVVVVGASELWGFEFGVGK
jgi:hypothetical protein